MPKKSATAMDHIYNGSTVSLNRGLTANAAFRGSDLSPIQKTSSYVFVPGSPQAQDSKLNGPTVRHTAFGQELTKVSKIRTQVKILLQHIISATEMSF